MTKPNLCIYHGNCADGFTAAWVVRNALGEENCDFFEGKYGESPPIDYHFYKNIYIVDFSYKRNVLDAISKVQLAYGPESKIIIIDHHKTAQEDLKDLNLPNVEVHFDMNHSGAMLTWMYFERTLNPYQAPEVRKDFCNEAPALIKRVEDRDLWRFKFSDTRTIQANIFSHEYTFENWDKLAATSMEKLAAEGEAIERKHFKDIKELLAACQTRATILGHDVPCANLPYIYSSDAGHMMDVGEKFAACYWYTATHCVFSLRSADDGMDVSEIAKQFGGGGHKHAAGFQIPIDVLPGLEANRINLFTV